MPSRIRIVNVGNARLRGRVIRQDVTHGEEETVLREFEILAGDAMIVTLYSRSAVVISEDDAGKPVESATGPRGDRGGFAAASEAMGKAAADIDEEIAAQRAGIDAFAPARNR